MKRFLSGFLTIMFLSCLFLTSYAKTHEFSGDQSPGTELTFIAPEGRFILETPTSITVIQYAIHSVFVDRQCKKTVNFLKRADWSWADIYWCGSKYEWSLDLNKKPPRSMRC